MTIVRHAGLMAGGNGSRMLAHGIVTPKPFVQVAGRPLVSYFLDEIFQLGITHVCAAVRRHDSEISSRLASDSRFEWTFIPTSGTGTLEAVLALTESLRDVDHLISTCDVILPRGAINRLTSAVELSHADALMVVLGTDLVHDVTPIWLHRDSERADVVTAIGKGIAESDLVFGNVRWVSRHMWSTIEKLDLAKDIVRDTQFMSHLVESCPGKVRVQVEPGVLDVDDLDDLRLAERLVLDGGQRY